MFRRTLEAITVDKGFKEKTLHKSLLKLFQTELLPHTFEEWIKEVRMVGNIGAHFDPIEAVDVDDAGEIQSFIEELLNHVYIIPSNLNNRRSKIGLISNEC